MHKVRRMLLLLILGAFLMSYIPARVGAEEIGLKIEVGEPGQKTASFCVNQPHSWRIRAKVQPNWENITILQTLPPELTLDTTSIGACIMADNGERILLRMEEHYLLTAGSVFVEAGVSDRFCVTFTPEGIAFLREYMTRGSELLIRYKASINARARMGSQIVGTAQMNLNNDKGKKYIFLSDKAVVSTGGFQIFCCDSMGNPLKGGKFMLAREATQAELEDSRYEKEILEAEGKNIAVLYQRFYPSSDLEGGKTDQAVTDEHGAAWFYGLAYGTYYLVQTESAQENYLPSKPIPVQINEVSHLTSEDGWTDGQGTVTDNTIHVVGAQLLLPNTGGPGTIAYTLSGVLVILCACMLLWYNRRGTSFI